MPTSLILVSCFQLQVLSKEGVIEVFNIKHVTIIDRLAMLSFMPKGFSPRVADQKAEKKSKKSLEPQKSVSKRTGDKKVVGLTPAGLATFFCEALIMKYFLRSFSLFR